VSKGKYLPLIPRTEGYCVSKSCFNPLRENIVTCKDPDAQAFLDEVGGLKLDLQLRSNLDGIPAYIPILDLGACKHDGIPDETQIVGISLPDLVSNAIIFKAGAYHIQDKIRFRTDILLQPGFRGKKVVLFLSGPDSLIENIWYHRKECHFYETIKQMGFWGVSGFNFSVIGGECPFSQALNIKRSLFSSFELDRIGIQAIPHVYAISRSQIGRWIDWFRQNPSIKYFAMNCQLQKKQDDIRLIISAVTGILSSSPRLHAVLQGFPLPEARSFGPLLNRIHFADAQPVKNAQSHKSVQSVNSSFECVFKYDRSKSISQLITKNIRDRIGLFEELRRYRFSER